MAFFFWLADPCSLAWGPDRIGGRFVCTKVKKEVEGEKKEISCWPLSNCSQHTLWICPAQGYWMGRDESAGLGEMRQEKCSRV